MGSLEYVRSQETVEVRNPELTSPCIVYGGRGSTERTQKELVKFEREKGKNIINMQNRKYYKTDQ